MVTIPDAKAKEIFMYSLLSSIDMAIPLSIQPALPEVFMQEVQHIRNTVILGHGNSGKTTLADAMLFTSGAVNRFGKVDDGSSVMDFEPEEIKRQVTISTAFHHINWQKNEIFLSDTPGDDNFVNETKFASQVADSAILTVGAVLGVRSQTERFVDFVGDRHLPCLICITKMDRERANFQKTVDELKESFNLNPVILYLPIGAEDQFKGVVDIAAGKGLFFAEDGSGKVTVGDIPADMVDDVAAQRENLMEYVAETDDDLIEKFLEEGELSAEELSKGLAAAVRQAKIAPVCAVSALNNAGTTVVLDAISEYLPSPDERPAQVGTDPQGELVERSASVDEPFSALVFKTMADPFAGRLTIFRVYSGKLSGDSFYNATRKTSERFGHLFILEGKEQQQVDEAIPGMIVAVAKLKETVTGDTLCDENHPVLYDVLEPIPAVISYAVNARKGDEEKLFSSITRMLDEDLTLQLTREEQTHEVLMSGVGQVHLEAVAEKMKRKFGVEMELRLPRVPYRETIKKSVTVQGKHKKQSGGRGQYGDCTIEMSPLPRGEGFEFVDSIVGGVIPQQYRPAVEKGIVEAMEKGVIAGYPCVDVKINLIDGSYHNVDSSEMAFKIAGSLAFKKGALAADPIILEPVLELEVQVDKEHVGDVMGDLNSRRGKVLGMDATEKHEIVRAHVPQSEVQLYAPDLTSMTGGRGSFTVKFSHYEEVPAHLAEKIIEQNNKE